MLTFVLLIALQQCYAIQLTMYTVPWCGHCQKLRAELDKSTFVPTLNEWNIGHSVNEAGPLLAPKLAVDVSFVNCEEEKEVCESVGVFGYPEIVASVEPVEEAEADARNDDALLAPFVHASLSQLPLKYPGRDRSAAAIGEWIRSLASPPALLVSSLADGYTSLDRRVDSPVLTLTCANLDQRLSFLRDQETALLPLIVDATTVGTPLLSLVDDGVDACRLAYQASLDATPTVLPPAAATGGALATWLADARTPLCDEHSIAAYGLGRPFLFMHLIADDLANDPSSASAQAHATLCTVSSALRAENVSLRFAWLSHKKWSGTRAGLSGKVYPSVHIDDIRHVNSRYVLPEDVDLTGKEGVRALTTFARAFEAGELTKARVSEPVPEDDVEEAGRVRSLVLSSFDEAVLGRPHGTLVMFHSPSCGTCQTTYPVFEGLAREFAAQWPSTLRFARANAWENDWQFDVTGVPDFRYFAPDGTVTEYHDTDFTAEGLGAWIENVLGVSRKVAKSEL
uniref:Thioredoxin domain-containing protein n=1 Tax=Sexangularia sp. CB-2014 TaxID=1486929 RepID=A0A7S1VSQ5_9EUKA|mmetsp:Transcript_9364/g.29777  ORF Transcript_9364/g.29777 Transcript_9364/m.29777 type:complete len:511 (+) Transcript_9364:113-1645(+)